jgi:threonine synthase
MAKIAYFECSRCRERLSAEVPRTVCPKCAGLLYVRYDLDSLRSTTEIEGSHVRLRVDDGNSTATMWRYRGVLPDVEPLTLGEGFTPLLHSRENPNLLIKDEGLNPTGSFKARGMSLAVSMARAYGFRKLAVSSAGNAGGALAAYAAAAGIEAHVFMPEDAPQANILECMAYGARLTLVRGLIGDCARIIGERSRSEGWFDLSSLKEPFRVEGKKTMGYEIAEQLGWELPDAVICPTGGGVAMIGMWKAFEEMEQLGCVAKNKAPRMIAVQPSGCAPIVKALDEGRAETETWPNASTIATGLRVSKPFGGSIILDILRRSGGAAVAVSDAEILDALRYWASAEGVFASPEGAASLAGYRKLSAQGFLTPNDRVVLFNTASGLKYADVIAAAEAKRDNPKSRAIGGIIQPY